MERWMESRLHVALLFWSMGLVTGWLAYRVCHYRRSTER